MQVWMLPAIAMASGRVTNQEGNDHGSAAAIRRIPLSVVYFALQHLMAMSLRAPLRQYGRFPAGLLWLYGL